MKLLMMSMLLLSFLPVICSGHRTPPGRRTPYLSRDQFRRICEEIADLKKADEDLKKANEELIKANDDLKKADEYLKKANEELIKANDDLKKADEELIRANEGLKKDNEDLKEATTDLQNRIFAIESSVNEPGKKLSHD